MSRIPTREEVDRMKIGIRSIIIARAILEAVDVEAIAAECRRFDDLGPVLDPTMFREKGKANEVLRAHVEGALKFKEIVPPGTPWPTIEEAKT